MKRPILLATLAAMTTLSLQAAPARDDLDSDARQILAKAPADAAAAVKRLRDAGPAGLDSLLRTYREEIAKVRQGTTLTTADGRKTAPLYPPNWQTIGRALDKVSAQRDSYASQLYWHTDLSQAREAAAKAEKPILSLRLLGKLDEEYSCANSRFFRTTLYSNEEVGKYLRENFVLHWESVRPVPRITIDFGDGRKIDRTVTGNSVHYILAADGRPLDALPGLYGAKAFLRGLAKAKEFAATEAGLEARQKDAALRTYHAFRLEELYREWNSDLAKIGNPKQTPPNPAMPAAILAAEVAVSKGLPEKPLLRVSGNAPSVPDNSVPDETWKALATLHSEDASLDRAARVLVTHKGTSAQAAGKVAASKSFVEMPMITALKNLERSIAEDTVRNEYLLHSTIHQWFLQPVLPRSVNELNERVYAELFLTPTSDPWLGLAPADAYSALENQGLTINSQE